jgi:hypothetical protein
MAKFDDIVEDFAKDSKKENDGVWMTYKRHQFLIARAHRNNTKFLKTLEEKMRPFQWAIDRGNFGAIREAANEQMQVIYSETVLLGIRKLGSTEMLDYTPEDGVALFKKLPDFWDDVFKFSGNETNYTPDQVELDSKN